MQSRRFLFYAPILIGVASCASIAAVEPDGICRELATFANASTDKSTRTIELTTAWMGQQPATDSDKLSMATKNCKHGGFAAGATFCKWLMDHTSSEFAEINIRRALSCIGDAKLYAGAPGTSVEYLAGKIVSYDTKYVREDVTVTIEYSVSVKDKQPMLRISATRSPKL